MVFHFVHEGPAQQQALPPGFCVAPDGHLAIDDPTLTKVVKTELFDNSDRDSVESVHRTLRWTNPMHGWVPLAKFQEWVRESMLRPKQDTPEADAGTDAEGGKTQSRSEGEATAGGEA